MRGKLEGRVGVVGPNRVTRMRRSPAVLPLVSPDWLEPAVLRELADERAEDPPPIGVGMA
jgi:hypothetical protein